MVDITSKGMRYFLFQISVLSGCPEFADIQLRNSDKRVLNALNKNKTQETIRSVTRWQYHFCSCW